MPLEAAQQPEIDLVQSIRDLKAQVDEKLSAFNGMTTRKEENRTELAELEAGFDADLSLLRAELGDCLAASDTVRQVACEKKIFNLKGRREKLQNHAAAFDSALSKQRAELTELGHELRALEKNYWVDLFEQHRILLDLDAIALCWGLSTKAGFRFDDLSEFVGRQFTTTPGSSPRNPAKVPGLLEKLDKLSPYSEEA